MLGIAGIIARGVGATIPRVTRQRLVGSRSARSWLAWSVAAAAWSVAPAAQDALAAPARHAPRRHPEASSRPPARRAMPTTPFDARSTRRRARCTASEPSSGATSPPSRRRELRFHLYWNAWRDTNSTFLRERARSALGQPADEDDFARLDITVAAPVAARRSRRSPRARRRTSSTSADQLHRPRRRQRRRSDGDGGAAAQAVPPGDSVIIELTWTARVPGPFARTGAIGNFFFIAQWFPKLGVLEESGWNCHQFHAGTEFFSDYGVYDVSLTVPTGWIVGATGAEQRAARQRRRHDDPSLLPGRRSRLRLDDQPRLHRADRERSNPGDHAASRSAGRDAAAAPARACRPGRAALRRGTRRARALFGSGSARIRTATSPSSIRPFRAARTAWSTRRSSPPARAWLAPARGHDQHARRGHDSRNRPPVVVRHGRQQRVRGRLDGRGHQHLRHGARDAARLPAATVLRDARFFGGFVPWVVSRHLVSARETYWNRSAGLPDRAPKSDVPSDASYRFSPRRPARSSPTTRRRSG